MHAPSSCVHTFRIGGVTRKIVSMYSPHVSSFTPKSTVRSLGPKFRKGLASASIIVTKTKLETIVQIRINAVTIRFLK